MKKLNSMPLLVAIFVFTMAGAATTHADQISISPGFPPPKGAHIDVQLNNNNPNALYTGTVAGTGPPDGDVTPGNILGLVNGGGLKNPAGQPINLGGQIVNGEVVFPRDNIAQVRVNDSVDQGNFIVGAANLAQNGVIGNVILGGALAELDQNGNAATYTCGLGYGDETGNPTWFAQANLAITDLPPNPQVADLLTAIYNNLEAQLTAPLQNDLTLDLANNALNFAFPASIQDPSLGGYTTDTGVSYVVGLTVVPEPSTFALLGIGALGLLGYAKRRRKSKA